MLFLTSCRSLTMEDYQTNISPFKYQNYEFTLNVPDNIYVITQTNVGERAKIDNKQEHLKTVAYDVNSEIINKLGNDDNSIGSIIISQDVLNRKQGSLMTLLGSFPSILSLGTLNLVGYPFGTEEYTVQVNAVAYDLNGKQLKEYKATAKDWKFVACYYGYAPDQVQAAAYLSAYKEGLESVIDQINQDSDLHSLMQKRAQTIMKQNKQIAQKKKAEEAKRKALEQEAKRKQEAQKQEHIQSVSALTQLIKENLIAKNEFEYWKELYKKIDEKNIPAKDKKIIQTVFDAELEDEKEQTI